MSRQTWDSLSNPLTSQFPHLQNGGNESFFREGVLKCLAEELVHRRCSTNPNDFSSSLGCLFICYLKGIWITHDLWEPWFQAWLFYCQTVSDYSFPQSLQLNTVAFKAPYDLASACFFTSSSAILHHKYCPSYILLCVILGLCSAKNILPVLFNE